MENKTKLCIQKNIASHKNGGLNNLSNNNIIMFKNNLNYLYKIGSNNILNKNYYKRKLIPDVNNVNKNISMLNYLIIIYNNRKKILN